MKKPSSSGLSSAGQPLKKAEEDKASIVWVDQAGFYLLPMAAYLGTTRADARAAGQVDARSSLSHQWHTIEIIKSCSRQGGYSVEFLRARSVV
jgi:hypothetical protein